MSANLPIICSTPKPASHISTMSTWSSFSIGDGDSIRTMDSLPTMESFDLGLSGSSYKRNSQSLSSSICTISNRRQSQSPPGSMNSIACRRRSQSPPRSVSASTSRRQSQSPPVSVDVIARNVQSQSPPGSMNYIARRRRSQSPPRSVRASASIRQSKSPPNARRRRSRSPPRYVRASASKRQSQSPPGSVDVGARRVQSQSPPGSINSIACRGRSQSPQRYVRASASTRQSQSPPGSVDVNARRVQSPSLPGSMSSNARRRQSQSRPRSVHASSSRRQPQSPPNAHRRQSPSPPRSVHASSSRRQSQSAPIARRRQSQSPPRSVHASSSRRQSQSAPIARRRQSQSPPRSVRASASTRQSQSPPSSVDESVSRRHSQSPPNLLDASARLTHSKSPLSSTSVRSSSVSTSASETHATCTNTRNSSRISISVDLNCILRNHALGQALLNTKVLDSVTRTTLTDIVANHMLVNINGSITKEHYFAYTKAITELFPGELENIYFIPSAHQLTPKGKLYFRVTSLLAKRRSLDKSYQGPKRRRIDEETRVSFLDADESVPQSDISEWCHWLKINDQPESKVLDLWKKTARQRLTFIHYDTPKPTCSDIIAEWPRYTDDKGYFLVTEDFACMYPGKENLMTSMWPNLSVKMVPLLCRSKDKEAKAYQQIMCSAKNDSAKMACSLILLPTVLTESSVCTLSSGRGKRRSFWKPSVAESMSFFIDIVRPGVDLDRHLHKKEQAMKTLGLPLQPHVVMIVEDAEKIGEKDGTVILAVVQSNLFYEVPTVMAAVDTCLKACFVMHLGYCPGAKSSWLFLQRMVYGITTEHDDAGSKVLQLLADCNKF